jgi:hypothetical protein
MDDQTSHSTTQQKNLLLTHGLKKASGLASRSSQNNPQKKAFPENSSAQVRVPYHQVTTEGVDQCRVRMGPPFPRQPSIVEGAGGGGRRQLLQGQGCPRLPAFFGGVVRVRRRKWGTGAEPQKKRSVAWPLRVSECLEVSCWAGHAFFFLPVSTVQPIARMSEHFLFFSPSSL